MCLMNWQVFARLTSPFDFANAWMSAIAVILLLHCCNCLNKHALVLQFTLLGVKVMAIVSC
jgi:hypothetical protein